MDMLNIILLTFFVGTFVGGFWCGKTYGTAKAMFADWGQKVSGWFS